MKKSIILTIIFILPFIILTIWIETMLRGIPNEYMIKSNFMNANASRIKVLVLGSSHGITAIDPDCFSQYTYNCAHYAQSLDRDYNILNQYQYRLDSLEYIILPVSYHSLWTKIDLHAHKWRKKYYNIYYGFRVEQNPIKELIFLDETIHEDLRIIKDYYYNHQPIHTDLTPYGLAVTPSQTNLGWINSTIDQVVAAHSTDDLTRLYDENVSYLKKIIDIAQKKNAKVIFVTIPGHEIFVERLHPDQLNLLYTTMDKLKDNKTVFYYNFLHEFTKEDQETSLKYFHDADHLSYLGARTFSVKLDSIVKVLDKKEKIQSAN